MSMSRVMLSLPRATPPRAEGSLLSSVSSTWIPLASVAVGDAVAMPLPELSGDDDGSRGVAVWTGADGVGCSLGVGGAGVGVGAVVPQPPASIARAMARE